MSAGRPCLLSLICLVLSGLGADSQTGGAEEDLWKKPEESPGEKSPAQISNLTSTGRCRRPDGDGMIQGGREYYNVGESVTVKCDTGYRPSHEKINCIQGPTNDEWDPSPQCIAQCQRPAGEGMVPAGKEYYDKDEDLYVTCKTGYRPSPSLLSSYMWIRCINPRTSNEWNPSLQCIAQCKNLDDTDIYTISGWKSYYNVGESVSVQCRAGYRPLHERITCETRQNKDEWDNPPQCIEQCKKPSIKNLKNVAPYKEYYNQNEEVTLQCESGYYPSSDRIQCVNYGARDDWKQIAVCVGVNVTDLTVTSTSISLTFVCIPGPCQNNQGFNIVSCILHREVFKTCEYGNHVRFSIVKPFTSYKILIRKYSNRSWLILQTLHITSGESAPAAPEIVQRPSMENSTIVWKLGNNRGNITGFEMNIVAWRDYNSSFSLNVTERFPPNVTQHKINLQHGTNYTLRLRGFTSAGGGQYKVTTIETLIGALSQVTAGGRSWWSIEEGAEGDLPAWNKSGWHTASTFK